MWQNPQFTADLFIFTEEILSRRKVHSLCSESSCESWEELKLLLANEIKKITPENILEYITSKIQRAHRDKEFYSTTIQIIAKFSDWSYSESLKTTFIHAAKKPKERQPSNPYMSSKCIKRPYQPDEIMRWREVRATLSDSLMFDQISYRINSSDSLILDQTLYTIN